MQSVANRLAIMLIACGLFAALGACSEGEREIEYDGFVLTEEPSEAPRVFPPGFIYPDSKSVMGGVYTRSPYASTREGVLVYESEDPLPQIQAYYLRKFEAMGWQIIQSQERSGVVFLLAENLSRRLFTVILRDGMPATVTEAPEDAAADSESGAQPDQPLKPLSPTVDEADSAKPGDGVVAPDENAAPTVVQIKLYIKQAGLR